MQLALYPMGSKKFSSGIRHPKRKLTIHLRKVLRWKPKAASHMSPHAFMVWCFNKCTGRECRIEEGWLAVKLCRYWHDMIYQLCYLPNSGNGHTNTSETVSTMLCSVLWLSCIRSTARGVPAGGCSPHVPLENSFHSDQSDSAHTQPTLLFLTSMSPPTIFIVTLQPITNHSFRLWLYTICGVCYTPASKHYSIMLQQFDDGIKGDNNCNLMGISCYAIL